MAVAEATLDRFQMGRVVTRTFSVIGANIVAFSLLAFVVAVPLIAATLISSSGALAFSPGQGLSVRSIAQIGFGWLLALIGMFFLQAALVHGTVVSLNGKRPSFGDCLSTGLVNFLPLIVIAFIETFGLAFGFVLLFLPGFMLLVRWSVAVPSRVVEHTGILRSFGRSNELVRGHSWPIFGLLVAFFLLQLAVGTVFGAFSGMSFAPRPAGEALAAAANANLEPLHLLSTVLAQMINSVIGAAGAASIYYELRVIKEGIGPEALAKVFD
jgi:hypothetical protein